MLDYVIIQRYRLLFLDVVCNPFQLILSHSNKNDFLGLAACTFNFWIPNFNFVLHSKDDPTSRPSWVEMVSFSYSIFHSQEVAQSDGTMFNEVKVTSLNSLI
jgi:hypothetical protein